MFNVGGMELVVICLVALIVLGPDKLPGAIRELGRWTGELRRISQGFQDDFRTALNEAEREVDERETRHAVTKTAAATDTAQAELDALLAERAEDDTGDDIADAS